MLTMVSINSDTGYRAVPQLPAGVDDYGEEYKDLPVCPAFKQIGELRGPFDLGLIPIGAYWPRWYVYPPLVSVFSTTPHSSFLLMLELCRGARAIPEVLLQLNAFYVSRMDYLRDELDEILRVTAWSGIARNRSCGGRSQHLSLFLLCSSAFCLVCPLPSALGTGA